ncbi:hypothetical protein GGTG_06182 [Gaeumannomyces tritici R3-111a-1]|uniref:Uncharacterized protein n=1 Tax=Gaeumannomyces tritici (strain R3-111a-1) TaxID=644352 RepID=J3NY27_GAET3|nr:hypothetical protein GGTG_06182 [Gaeumannomyces tritici R3-111a-1]EJT76260.1 hypothetical protein GGTG_06182 [Gaeumannomyces tritici R3-111a-1]
MRSAEGRRKALPVAKEALVAGEEAQVPTSALDCSSGDRLSPYFDDFALLAKAAGCTEA